MATLTTNYQDSACVEKRVTTCTERVSGILTKLMRMRESLDRIEGKDTTQPADEGPPQGSLPQLEEMLDAANGSAMSTIARLESLADRI